MTVFASLALGLVFLPLGIPAQIPEQYPKPLLHTPVDHPAARVVLLSVDGLHAVDLARFIAEHPHSALAELSARGVTYTNAQTPRPDPAAGLMAFATGGTPISTGIITGDGFDRALSLQATQQIDLRVNTIFEVVHQKIGHTAWAGDTAQATDLLRGPSGQGLDDACGADLSDADRVTILLHWVDGKSCAGETSAVPSLFGMSFNKIAEAQRLSGYADDGTPSPGLARSLVATDESIARIIADLKGKHLYDSTWIVVVAPYGQAPMNSHLRHIDISRITAAANAAHRGAVRHITGGDAALIWLSDAAQTKLVVHALAIESASLGIQAIYSGPRLTLTLNSPAKDTRMPDVLLQAEPGVIWSKVGDTALAATGGFSDDDTHVALLISGAQLTCRSDPTLVPITQIAPLLMRAFGLEKFDLQALHQEHTPALPGIF